MYLYRVKSKIRFSVRGKWIDYQDTLTAESMDDAYTKAWKFLLNACDEKSNMASGVRIISIVQEDEITIY